MPRLPTIEQVHSKEPHHAMSPTHLIPRSQIAVDLSTLTPSELYALITSERLRHSPPWIYFLCGLWLFLMLCVGISNMLPPHRRLLNYCKIPDRFFGWAPGKEKFDLEWEAQQEVKRKEEARRERRTRVFAEQAAEVTTVRPARPEKGQMEEIELKRMLTPLEWGFRR
ncbi:hypothetical protein K458DRAFT_421203 [Lentithecium fluviatile CBS 122367]|uniref:Uncharacterized protein n=1 Tax=Lentithecium fluviatile CBS 122367 TaxID=1168545 RepID=A0A6G1ISB6_9PLEO|nr:hypothetical protein K458DRAFT_421203 [Lentithecium fluviatile CBS 122367]